MKAFGWVLVGLFVLVLVWLFFRSRKKAVTVPTAGAALRSGGTYENIVTNVENSVGKAFGIPAASKGLDAASKAPTWLKVALPVVALNGAVQSVIRSPASTAKKVASTTVGAAKAVGGAASSVGRTVGGAASSVGHAFSSIF